MKIYQVHESCGEYEYYVDRIIKSFTKKEKAEQHAQERKIEFKEKLKLSRKCAYCPLGLENEVTVTQLTKYCPRITRANFEVINEEVVNCNKYEFSYEENTIYRVEEIDVEE